MTGLEALKEFKGNNNTILVGRVMGKQHYLDCLQAIEKHLKALEIIKEKNVNIYQIKYMETLDDYNSVRDEEDRITQEEFDLLKEVLE